MRFEPIADKWAAFGWHVQREKNHFIRVDPPEWQQAIAMLDAAYAGAAQ
jgi:transketolase N-terminal domain/subunit